MVNFADVNISQGSVATYARCRVSFNIHITTNLPRNFPVKFFLKSVQTSDLTDYGHESIAPLFGQL